MRAATRSFGATVTYVDDEGVERTVTILGVDEADNARQQVSWISPVARALLKGPRRRRGGAANTRGHAQPGNPVSGLP